KSLGRKRHVSAFQCTPPPPTPFGGMKDPQLRIGRAVSPTLWRNVMVSCAGRRKRSWRVWEGNSAWGKGGGENGGGCAPRPPSVAPDIRPRAARLGRPR